MDLAKVRAFVADEMLEMAKFMESGLVYGKLELLNTHIEETRSAIQSGLKASPDDSTLLAHGELIDLFEMHVSKWCAVEDDSTAEGQRLSILQSLRDKYIAWFHDNHSRTHEKKLWIQRNKSNQEYGSERRRNLNKILRACAVEDYNGLYVLGSFDLKKTINAQQRRACGLVNALKEFGELKSGCEVAVVGGGVGGLTVAIGSAMEGASVTLFEENSNLIHYQSNNTQRFLHPNIFDWPGGNSTVSETKLPYLNWKSGLSDDVARQIINDFNRLKGKVACCGGGYKNELWRGFPSQRRNIF